ncbi:MAG: MFS transporter [Candidatus Firestonebacteria bacterium]
MFLNRPVNFILYFFKETASILVSQKEKITESFKAVQGNTKILLITGVFYTIPMVWFATYLPLYMIALIPQIIGLILGGHLVDIWGRKKVLVLFNTICWITSCSILLLSQNLWAVLIAMCLLGFTSIVIPGWNCLFVENTVVEKRPLLFSIAQISFVGSGLFMPIAGIIVKKFGILFGCRILFGIIILFVLFAFIIRQKNLVETKMQILEKISKPNFVKEYIVIIKKVFLDTNLTFFLIIQTITLFTTLAWNTYFPIYITDEKGIGIDKATISILPFIFSGLFVSMALLMPQFDIEKQLRNRLLYGMRFIALSSILLLLSPSHTMVLLFILTFILGLGTILFIPVINAYGANIMKDNERAKISAVILILATLFSILAVPVAGKLYEINPKLTFLFIVSLQFATILFIQNKFKIDTSSSNKKRLKEVINET